MVIILFSVLFVFSFNCKYFRYTISLELQKETAYAAHCRPGRRLGYFLYAVQLPLGSA